jgi:hypothetical protein
MHFGIKNYLKNNHNHTTTPEIEFKKGGLNCLIYIKYFDFEI